VFRRLAALGGAVFVLGSSRRIGSGGAGFVAGRRTALILLPAACAGVGPAARGLLGALALLVALGLPSALALLVAFGLPSAFGLPAELSVAGVGTKASFGTTGGLTAALVTCPLGGATTSLLGCLPALGPSSSAAPPTSASSATAPPTNQGVRGVVGIANSGARSSVCVELAWLVLSRASFVLKTCVPPLSNPPESEAAARGSE
jgi:hypothetical protein